RVQRGNGDADARARRKPYAASKADDRIEHRADRLESDRPSITEVGVRIPRPRPRNRPRSVSHCKPPTVSPSTTTTWASQIVDSLRARGRRVARRASSSGAHSVCTNRLENAGWAASADGDASTTSAYDVSSIS